MGITKPLTALPSIRERISEALPDHDRLVQRCIDTERAAQSLGASRDKLADLRRLVFGTRLELAISERCCRSTEIELEARRSQGTTFNRLSGGIFGRKINAWKNAQELEERFKEELRIVATTTAVLDSYKEQLAGAERAHKTLERAETDHKSALEALDALYESIFAGPTSEFPTEDQHELEIAEADHELRNLKSKAPKEQKALHILQQTAPSMQMLMRYMDVAVKLTAQRIQNPGDKRIHQRQEEAVRAAKNTAHQIKVLIKQARKESPEVLCRPVKIPDTPYLDEVERYPSAVSDSTESCLLEFYEALLSAQDDVKAWSKRLDREVMSSARRREDIGTKVVRAEKDLVDMRTKLREIRQDIFDEVMRELPGYRYEL